MRINVPLSKIDDNPYQPRQEYVEIDELAGRIAAARASYPDTFGIMQVTRARVVFKNARGRRVLTAEEIAPWVAGGQLCRDQDDPAIRVELGFGHRRKRALDYLHENGTPGYEAGLMPLDIGPLTDEQMLDSVWSENRDRLNISAVEEAELLRQKLDQLGASQREVAAAWGLGRSTVSNRLRLLEAPEAVQAANRAGKLSERACLALLTVESLREAVDGDSHGRWSSKTNPAGIPSWDAPVRPEHYLRWATNGASPTSDEIRGYVKQVQKQVGTKLPDDDAFKERDPACSGCRHQLNSHCFNAGCRADKIAAHGRALAQAEAKAAGVPYSDDEAHFEQVREHDKERLLKELWDADPQAIKEHLVIGWQPSGYAARPYSAGLYLSDRTLYENLRAGIALGWTGPVSLIAASEDGEESEPDPLTDKATEWKALAGRHKANVTRKAKAVLIQHVTDDVYGSGTLDFICLMTQGDKFPADQPFDELVKAAVNHLWSHGSYFTWENRDPYLYYEAVVKLLERYGYYPEQVLGEDAALEARAIFALAFWSERRGHSWQRDNAARLLDEPVTEMIAGFEDHLDACELPIGRLDTMVELLEYLELVEAEILEILEPQKEVVDTN